MGDSRRLVLVLIVIGACGEFAPGDTTQEDAAVSPDAPTVFRPIVLEAERFDASEPDGEANAWIAAANPAASGGNSVAVPEGEVSPCMVMAELGSCLPRLRFEFSLDRVGSYFVHIRGLGANASSDSSWYYTDSSAEALVATWSPEAFSFSTQPPVPFALSAGAHSLFIAHREDGAEVDVVIISDSAETPVLDSLMN